MSETWTRKDGHGKLQDRGGNKVTAVACRGRHWGTELREHGARHTHSALFARILRSPLAFFFLGLAKAAISAAV